MAKLENLTSTGTTTHLFFHMNNTDEVIWLLRRAGIKDFKIHSGRKVLRNQVRELKSLSEKERNDEIDSFYDGMAEHVKLMPSVIISEFDAHELFDCLKNTLMGERDSEYAAYLKKKSEALQEDETDFDGICIMTRE